ncbi:hypothetical protein KKI24_27240 [bacterium]|nr:hypothetical protein [bacterium]
MAVSEESYMEQLIDEFVVIERSGAWEFAIEIEDGPNDAVSSKMIDTLAKDISYEPITINVEEKNYGSQQVALPMNQERVTATITLRDDKKKTNYRWCKQEAGKIIHDDGTFGVPIEYVKRFRFYSTTDKSDEPDEWGMFITNVGEISRDRSSKEHLQFTITVTQFKTSSVTIDQH